MGWWKPGAWGYAPGLSEAGRFTREEALEICRRAIMTSAHIRVISEIPVRLADVEEFLRGEFVPEAIIGAQKMKDGLGEQP